MLPILAEAISEKSLTYSPSSVCYIALSLLYFFFWVQLLGSKPDQTKLLINHWVLSMEQSFNFTQLLPAAHLPFLSSFSFDFSIRYEEERSFQSSSSSNIMEQIFSALVKHRLCNGLVVSLASSPHQTWYLLIKQIFLTLEPPSTLAFQFLLLSKGCMLIIDWSVFKCSAYSDYAAQV